MPSKSKSQQRLMAMALHSPGKLYSRNKAVAKMGKGDLRDYAETPRKGLPSYAENIRDAAHRRKK